MEVNHFIWKESSKGFGQMIMMYPGSRMNQETDLKALTAILPLDRLILSPLHALTLNFS